MDISLKGKRALVTGGNSGIGAAVVKALASAGARVAVNYLNQQTDAEDLVAEINAKHGDAFAVRADVSQPDAVTDMFGKIDLAWNGIDILVNNAGIDGKRALSWETDISTWKNVIEVNLLGAFYTARQALKRMISQKGGVILNMSSVHEIIAWSGYTAYTASKAGLGMMTRTMAQEAAPYGVRVLAVGPGAIKTPINKAVWNNPISYQDLIEKIPLKRLGEPEDIARIVVVLVSDVGAYVTGRTLYIDGGMTDYPNFATGG
jgi:glucose 1-dehydrogenase